MRISAFVHPVVLPREAFTRRLCAPQEAPCASTPRPNYGALRRAASASSAVSMLQNGEASDKDRSLERGESYLQAHQDALGSNSDVPAVPRTLWLELKSHLLRMVMQRAVQNEKYEEAGRLKGELDSLNALLMLVLESSVLQSVADLRKEMRKSDSLRLQFDLESALAEEDFKRADSTRLEIHRVLTNSPAFSGLKYFEWAWLESDLDRRIRLRHAHMAWLESDVCSRLAFVRSLQAKQLKDEVFRLQHNLKQQILEENFANAAQIRDALAAENIRRSQVDMWSQLDKQVKRQKRNIERLLPYPEKLLEHQLKEAIEKEDYENAAIIRAQLADLYLLPLLDRLRQETVHMLQMLELDKVKLLEEKLTLAIHGEEYETAAQLRNQLADLERNEMMTVLEEKLVEYGAKCFTARDMEDEEYTNQFYYLGNLQMNLEGVS